MTQPDTLHTRLEDEINRRLAVARAATPGPWTARQSEQWERIVEAGDHTVAETHFCDEHPGLAVPDADHIALHGPADAVRRYEGELEVLERHVAETFADTNLPEMLDLDPDDPWCRTCRGNLWPCADLISLAGRLGVSVDG